ESSSYMEMGPLMRWFTANIGFHHVHHLNPAIPFYRLPEAMNAIPALQTPGRTNLSPKEIAACLRLKLWEPDHGHMIGWHSPLILRAHGCADRSRPRSPALPPLGDRARSRR